MFSLTPKQGKLLFSVLMAASLVIFLAGLGKQAFLDYDEATYAQVAKEAVQSGDYFSFTLWGQGWLDKPPFYFWMGILSAKFFGFSEFALRLPSALCGIIAVALTWLFVLKLSKNYGVAFLAGAILLFMGEFAFAARELRLDVPVATAILASVYFFIRGWENGKWFLAMGATLAIGVLTKSIVGLFAFPAILAFSLAYRRFCWLKSAYFWAGIILAVGLAAPWHIYEARVYGKEFWDTYVVYHLFGRASQAIIGSGVTIRHYIKYFFILTQPWASIFIGLLVWQITRQGKKLKNWNPMSLGALLSFLAIFAIFAVSVTKLFYYLEPIYPFMAVFIASSLYDFTGHIKMERKKILAAAGFLIIIGICNTYWQVFNLREGFSEEYGIAGWEREAGKIVSLEKLNGGESNAPVYSLEWNWLESLSYYGGEKVNMLTGDEIAGEAFYLITPAKLFNYYRPSKVFRERARLISGNETFEVYILKNGEQGKIYKQ